MKGGDGTAFSVKCDESTLTTAGILAVKDHGIGREKLKERLYGRYKMNISEGADILTISGSNNIVPFNNQVWFNDSENLVDITSSESTFVITANQQIALRVSIFVSLESWVSPTNGESLILKLKKNDSYFALDHFIVQNSTVAGNSIISLKGSTVIYMNTDDELNVAMDNTSNGDVFMVSGNAGTNISFEEI